MATRTALFLRRHTVVVLACSMASCGDGGPTRPTPPTRPSFTPLHIQCAGNGIHVRCHSYYFGLGDVTDETEWWASETFLFAEQTDAVRFTSPGVATPQRKANIYIRGRTSFGGGDISRFSYSIDPLAPAERRAYLTGSILDEQGSEVRESTVVEIVGGPDADKRVVTSTGRFMIEHVTLFTPLMVRATPTGGYQPLTQLHPGIQQQSISYAVAVIDVPRDDIMHFRLKRGP